ncbi:MAG: DUF4421 family protein [Flavobacteriales bacterium]
MRILSPFALFAGLCCCAPVHAQLGERVRTMLNGDSAAAPDHDTTYITTYHSNLTISVVSKLQMVDIDLEQDGGGGLEYSTNSNEQYGVGVNYKWLSAEVTFNIPVFNQYDASLGETNSRGFGLGYTGRRLWARGFWNNTQGYYMDDPARWVAGWAEGDAPVVREDLETTTFMLSVNYALSGKGRFSQNAALFQMERQKKSAGTFVAGLSAWSSDVAADSSLISPALMDTFQLATGFTGVERTLIGLTIGYTHTFAFWEKGFIHMAILPGVAYAQQTITVSPGEELSGTGTAAVTEFKFGAGFNGDRWYTALTTAFYYSTTPIADKLGLGTNYGSVKIALGIRLGGPKVKALQKVGL